MEHGRRIRAGHFLLSTGRVHDTFLEVLELARFGFSPDNLSF
jgi:hypothetical protein